MKLIRVLAVALTMGVVAPAQAAFIGDYAYSNWDARMSVDGVVTSFNNGECAVVGVCSTDPVNVEDWIEPGDDAPENLSIWTAYPYQGMASNWQDFSIVAAYDGIISFDWSVLLSEDFNPNGQSFSFGYFVNDVFTILMSETLNVLTEGDTVLGLGEAVSVSQGEIFSFRLASGGEQDLNAIISNFNFERAPGSGGGTVPAPAPLALLGLGLVAMAYARRQAA